MSREGKIAGLLGALRARIASILRWGAMRLDDTLALASQKPEGHVPVRVPVAGVGFENRARAVAQLSLREIVRLRREPANPKDGNAIVVERRDGKKLGYVGKGMAAKLAAYMDAGNNPLQAMVTELTSDISGSVVGVAVNLCIPERLHDEIKGIDEGVRYYCDAGDAGAVYAFVDCDEAVLSQIGEQLAHSGLPWLRCGLAYRPAADGRMYRWYVRFMEGVSQEEVERFFRDLPGVRTVSEQASDQLEEYIAAFDGENRELKEKISRLTATVASLQEQLGQAKRQSLPPGMAAQRGGQDLRSILQVLLPNVVLLRDSYDVIAWELHDQAPVLRMLREMDANPAGLKADRVECAPGWWERHFGTGQKDDGRLYFKKADGKYLALVSFKKCQRKDFDYLKAC